MKSSRGWFAACIATIVLAGAGAAYAQSEGAEFTWSQFQALHDQLAPPEQAWRALPWHTSLLQAQALAAREKKPVYMLVRSGQPLGCV